MIRPRIVLIIIGIIIMVLSIIPLLKGVDVSISGFNIAETIEDSAFPENATPYFAIIFVLGLFAAIFGLRARMMIVH